MSAAQWCMGHGTQPPHVPRDGALIEVRQPASFRYCRTCWLAYVSQANDQPKEPTDG